MLNLTEVSLTPLETNPVGPTPLLPGNESLDLELSPEATDFEAILGELIAGTFSEQPVTPAKEEEEPPEVKAPEDASQTTVPVLTMPPLVFGPEQLVLGQQSLKQVEAGQHPSLPKDGSRVAEPADSLLLASHASGPEEEESMVSTSDDLFAKYEVRKIEFAFEQIEQPAADERPAAAEQPTAAVKPAAVQQLVITDPLASLRQGGKPVMQVVLTAGKTAIGGKSRQQDRPTAETPRQDMTASFLGAPRHEFQTEVAKVESVRSVPDIELPPPPPVARRVSMEIGELDSQVTVTIRERNGDLTLHFDSANNNLRHDLEASVDSLAQMFEREQLRLADVGFSSFGSATDAEQQSPDQRSRKNLKPGAVFADKDETYQFHHAAFALKSNTISS